MNIENAAFLAVIIVAILGLLLFFLRRGESNMPFNLWQKILVFAAILVPSIICLPLLIMSLIFYGIVSFTGDDGSGAGMVASVGLPIGVILAIVLALVIVNFITRKKVD